MIMKLVSLLCKLWNCKIFYHSRGVIINTGTNVNLSKHSHIILYSHMKLDESQILTFLFIQNRRSKPKKAHTLQKSCS